ncbi:MAG: glycosyltransferase family 2 protein [Clostridiales bacterium]|nr:glycosyltransferase family 2 protein [Clostridiales bacterium]
MERLISIVLPIYNGERYMRESIDSICAQTYANWELLIVDDGSTDATASIAGEYAGKDPHIHYYKNPQNMGLPKTLNRGFLLAHGEYLTWTSDDNYYYPTALEVMCNVLERENKDLVFASYDVIDENGTIVDCIRPSSSFRNIITGWNPVGACFMYSRKAYEATGEYDPDLPLVEDFDYWQRIFMKFEPAAIYDTLYAYRHHGATLTSTMKKEVFYRTLEKCLLKNRPGFGKLDCLSSCYFYQRLYDCQKNLNEDGRLYRWKYQFYWVLSLGPRVLNRLREALKKRLPNSIKSAPGL